MSLPFPIPAVGPGASIASAAAIATSYVGILYVFKSTRLVFASNASGSGDGQRQRAQGEQWRNDPRVIRARLAAVSFSTASSCVLVFLLVWQASQGNAAVAIDATIELLGFSPAAQTLWPHLLTPLLFAGPLYVSFLEGTLPFQSHSAGLTPLYDWQSIRNYIAGPVTEEINFRSCVTAVLILGGWHSGRLIFIAPLSFGVAHLHHAWDLYNRYGRGQAALKQAAILSLVQFTYTTLFGVFCMFLLLRTGSILPPLTSHVLCNIMGLPNPGPTARAFPSQRLLIWGSHLAGIIGFFALLWRLSEPVHGGKYYWQM